MVEESPQIHVSLSLPYAVVLSEWLGQLDSALALAHGSIPLTDITEKLGLDHLQEQLRGAPEIYSGQWRHKLAAARARVLDDRHRHLQDLVRGVLASDIDAEWRDDCAAWLADFDDPDALDALMRVAADPDDEWLHDQVGESIADIVKRHPERGAGLGERMSPGARNAYRHFLEAE